MSWFRKPKVLTDEKAVDELLSRGVEEVIVLETLRKKLLSGECLRIKLGIDPTSPDLHIGRAVPLLKLRDFQKLGHQVVFIVGDFTAVIGDTSDKDSERPMLKRDVIEKNKKSYFEQVGKLLDMSKVEMYYNSEWLKKLTYREIGEHADMFSVADFVARENISKRLEIGKRVSLREVLYPLMQGYDSVAVRADVEIGGTDQKFNLLAGRTMQEKTNQRPQDIVMNPLIAGLDGRKMSSSWGNTVALTAAPQDMFGKVMSMADHSVPAYFEICTRVPMQEVAKILQNHPKDAKMRLAKEIVELYHGAGAAMRAEADWINTFSGGGVPENVQKHSTSKGTPLIFVLVEAFGESNANARRLFQQGAVCEVGGETIDNPLTPTTHDMILRVGKHRFLSVKVHP